MGDADVAGARLQVRCSSCDAAGVVQASACNAIASRPTLAWWRAAMTTSREGSWRMNSSTEHDARLCEIEEERAR